MQLFTIGHSNLSIEAFVALLQQHGVTAPTEVRSAPLLRQPKGTSSSEAIVLFPSHLHL